MSLSCSVGGLETGLGLETSLLGLGLGLGLEPSCLGFFGRDQLKTSNQNDNST